MNNRLPWHEDELDALDAERQRMAQRALDVADQINKANAAEKYAADYRLVTFSTVDAPPPVEPPEKRVGGPVAHSPVADSPKSWWIGSPETFRNALDQAGWKNEPPRELTQGGWTIRLRRGPQILDLEYRIAPVTGKHWYWWLRDNGNDRGLSRSGGLDEMIDDLDRAHVFTAVVSLEPKPAVLAGDAAAGLQAIQHRLKLLGDGVPETWKKRLANGGWEVFDWKGNPRTWCVTLKRGYHEMLRLATTGNGCAVPYQWEHLVDARIVQSGNGYEAELPDFDHYRQGIQQYLDQCPWLPEWVVRLLTEAEYVPYSVDIEVRHPYGAETTIRFRRGQATVAITKLASTLNNTPVIFNAVLPNMTACSEINDLKEFRRYL